MTKTHENPEIGYFVETASNFASIQVQNQCPAIVLSTFSPKAHEFCIYLDKTSPKMQIFSPNLKQIKTVFMWDVILKLEELGLMVDTYDL